MLVLAGPCLMGQGHSSTYKLDSIAYFTQTKEGEIFDHYQNHRHSLDSFCYAIRHYFSYVEESELRGIRKQPEKKTLIVDKTLVCGQYSDSTPSGRWLYNLYPYPCERPSHCGLYFLLNSLQVDYDEGYQRVSYYAADLKFYENDSISGIIEPGGDLPSAKILCVGGDCEYFPADGSEVLYGHINALKEVLFEIKQLKIRPLGQSLELK